MANVLSWLKEQRRVWRYKRLLTQHKMALPLEADPLRVYVIVNADFLPAFHRALQGAHALVRLTHQLHDNQTFQKWLTEDETLIFLRAGETKLIEMATEIEEKGKIVVRFKEIDLGDKLTAISFEPIPKSLAAEWFKDLEMA